MLGGVSYNAPTPTAILEVSAGSVRIHRKAVPPNPLLP